MSAPLTRYEDYKETGLPWVGQCPAHWLLRRMKYLFDERVEKGYPEEPLLTASQSRGVIPKADYGTRTVEATKDLHLLKLVRPGDYVISLRSFQGGIEYAHVRGIISPAYTVLKPNSDVRRGYYEHFFKSAAFINSMSLFVTGIREGQNIDYVRLSRAYMPVPAPDEQDAIGRFIRHLDQRVNRLIKTKRRLIELLNEQKQAIIHRAVTRGLDPTVLLKSSGIEWLGDVPEHWTIRKVSRTFKTTGSGTTPPTGNRAYYEDGEVPWVNTGDLKNCELLTTSKFVTALALQQCSALKVFPAGSVIIAMYGATIGKVGLLRVPACVNQACCVLADSPYMLPEYAAQLFIAFRDDVVRLGVGGGQPNISQDIIKQLRLPVPPFDEQEAILQELGQSTLGLDQAVGKTIAEIDLIREYRTRLVADVVTGQLDVRHLDLPEVEESLIEAIDAVESDDPEDAVEDLEGTD